MARTFHRRERLAGMNEINVTPLIDLAFALLIIFMITAPLLEQTIDLQLPQESVRPQNTSDEPAVRISLDAGAQLYWEREQISWDLLEERLLNLAAAGDPPVLHIRADSGLPYQRVIDLMDRVKKSGLTRISLDTQSR